MKIEKIEEGMWVKIKNGEKILNGVVIINECGNKVVSLSEGCIYLSDCFLETDNFVDIVNLKKYKIIEVYYKTTEGNQIVLKLEDSEERMFLGFTISEDGRLIYRSSADCFSYFDSYVGEAYAVIEYVVGSGKPLPFAEWPEVYDSNSDIINFGDVLVGKDGGIIAGWDTLELFRHWFSRPFWTRGGSNVAGVPRSEITTRCKGEQNDF